MSIQMLDKRVPSTDGIHDLVGRVYLPDGYPETAPKGLFHVVHGMTEYIGRYDAFMQSMAAAGYVVFGYDHLGHGQTATDKSELGYIAPKDGWDILCRDVKAFAEAMRAEYGEGLPYVLMGHSMGSFIARLAAERYITPDRLIIMGTGGPNPAAGLGLGIIGITKRLRGERHISKLVYALAFGGYNNRFKEEKDVYAWLTTDMSIRDRYRVDPLCTFPFTVSAMGDLIRLTKEANRPAWFTSLPKDLPVLLVSGAEDPVGGNGRGVLAVRDRLQRAGISVTCRIYEGARHEILNDACRADVTRDIQEFVG